MYHSLWSKVTKAMHERDMDTATKEKTAIEDRQRKQRTENEHNNVKHTSRFFVPVDDGDFWRPKLLGELMGAKDGKVAKQTLKEWIFPSSKSSQ